MFKVLVRSTKDQIVVDVATKEWSKRILAILLTSGGGYNDDKGEFC